MEEYCGLTLRYHGGHCCGVTHIHNFGAKDRKEPPITKKPSSALAGHTTRVNILGDKYGAPLSPVPEIPEETTVQRLDRCLEWLKTYLKYGVTEVILTSQQAVIWADILLSRGFKEVSNCLNSNSSNRIHIYHLCRDVEAAPAPKQAPLR